jgi:ubiquinone/menaquinone biosynthesis C-methylase UbiE
MTDAAEVRKIREAAVRLHDEHADDFAHSYDEMRKDYFASAFTYGRSKLDKVLDQLLLELPKGSRILDVGCGTGEQLMRYSRLGLDCAGVEPAPKMRSLAQRLNPGMPIVDSSVTKIPFPDRSFDFVMAIEVLRYLDTTDVNQAYQELLRVLRPGGTMFITMVNRYAFDGFYVFDRVRKLVAGRLPFSQWEPVHCEFVTPAQVRRDLEAFGAQDIMLTGRMFAPLRLAYKANAALGSRMAQALESFDDSLANKNWHVPFAGHLIAIAKRGGD